MENKSIIHWHQIESALPDRSAYVLICQVADDGELICFEAAFENGAFWYLTEGVDIAIDPVTVIGWAWLPYDQGSKDCGKM